MYWLNLAAAAVIFACALTCVLHPRINIPSWSIVSMGLIMLSAVSQVAHQLTMGYTPSAPSVWMHAGIAVSWAWHLCTIFARERRETMSHQARQVA
jgi:hypothetical protein